MAKYQVEYDNGAVYEIEYEDTPVSNTNKFSTQHENYIQPNPEMIRPTLGGMARGAAETFKNIPGSVMRAKEAFVDTPVNAIFQTGANLAVGGPKYAGKQALNTLSGVGQGVSNLLAEKGSQAVFNPEGLAEEQIRYAQQDPIMSMANLAMGAEGLGLKTAAKVMNPLSIIPAVKSGVGMMKASTVPGELAEGTKSLLMKAIKPSKGMSKQVEQAMPTAIPLAAREAEATGIANDTLANMHSNIISAEKSVWNEIEGRTSGLGADAATAGTDDITRSMIGAIDQRTAQLNPNYAKSVIDKASRYKQRMSLSELEDYLQSANNELLDYYAQSGFKRKASMNDPNIAPTLAERDALAKTLYGRLDALERQTPPTYTGGKSIAQLKKEYGALKALEGAVEDSATIAKRSAPANLSESVGLPQAAGRFVGGILRRDPVGAIEGVGQAGVSTYIKQLNSRDNLLKRAMSGIEYNRPNVLRSNLPARGIAPRGINDRSPIDQNALNVLNEEVNRRIQQEQGLGGVTRREL